MFVFVLSAKRTQLAYYIDFILSYESLSDLETKNIYESTFSNTSANQFINAFDVEKNAMNVIFLVDKKHKRFMVHPSSASQSGSMF